METSKARLCPGHWAVVITSMAMGLVACSPVFNWREVPVDGQVKALMPCKPDRAERELPIAPEGVNATIGMAGCATGGATFAVAHWQGLTAGEAAERMHLWQSATRAQWPQSIVEVGAVSMSAMAEQPPPQQWQLSGPTGQGAAAAQMRWFARADAKGALTLYQATVLGTPSEKDAASTFFNGLLPR